MTRIHADPTTFATDALDAFSDVNRRLVRRVTGGVVRSTLRPRGKVSVVVGGGSGHYPAFAGYVGPGLADAAVAGDVFASPSTRLIQEVARRASRGGGVLLGFGNYAGDVLNFGLAAERLRGEGIEARTLAVSDDVASATTEDSAAQRRGIAGDFVVFKIAGAAAEAGLDLDAVESVAVRANERTRSLGVAFGGCTLPGAREPLFSVPARRMAVGLGIHGEPGIDEHDVLPAGDLADLLVAPLLRGAPEGHGGRIAAVLNGLGSVKYEELFVLWGEVAKRLRATGLELVAPEVGEFVTSLDMAGCSLTLTWLDEELERFWLAPAASPAFHRGQIAAEPDPEADAEEETAARVWPPADADSRACARTVVGVFERLVAELERAEAELGRLDALAGDGDHGRGMTAGSRAALAAARETYEAGAGAASVLGTAADAWADRAGGTSGVLWGVLLRAWAGALSDEGAPRTEQLAEGARRSLVEVTRLGGAKAGDKTMVDALEPFVAAFQQNLTVRQNVADAYGKAAGVASEAADATCGLRPRLGRARPLAERSVGHPDPGAVSFALCARTVAAVLRDGENPGERA